MQRTNRVEATGEETSTFHESSFLFFILFLGPTVKVYEKC